MSSTAKETQLNVTVKVTDIDTVKVLLDDLKRINSKIDEKPSEQWTEAEHMTKQAIYSLLERNKDLLNN